MMIKTVEHRWVPAFLTAALWVGSDPNPEYSRLDHLDGLKEA